MATTAPALRWIVRRQVQARGFCSFCWRTSRSCWRHTDEGSNQMWNEVVPEMGDRLQPFTKVSRDLPVHQELYRTNVENGIALCWHRIGSRAHRNLQRKLFCEPFINSLFIIYHGLACAAPRGRQRQLLAGLGSGRDVRPGNGCWCCVGKAIGIPACVPTSAGREAKSRKCNGRSEAGLVANSPGRRHCHNLKFTKAVLDQR